MDHAVKPSHHRRWMSPSMAGLGREQRWRPQPRRKAPLPPFPGAAVSVAGAIRAARMHCTAIGLRFSRVRAKSLALLTGLISVGIVRNE
jgi:hypothetical protein